MTHRASDLSPAIDLETAKPIVSAFSGACGLDCHLIAASGEVLFSSFRNNGCCHCRVATGDDACCDKIRLYGAYQAERFGGRYIYYCVHGFAWCSSSILVGGKLVGSLACGPAQLMELEDYLACQPYQSTLGSSDSTLAALNHIPYKSPSAFGDISTLLLTAAAYLGEHSQLLDLKKSSAEQQRHIGDTLRLLSATQEVPVYPLAKERELTRAIREGDQAESRRLLNDLLGHIIFYTGGDFMLMRTRSLELMSVLSRAATDGGADLDQVLSLNHQFVCESAYLQSADDLTIWLTHVIERYTELVFDLVDIKHKDLIYRAINYIKRHSSEQLTLEDVARYTGFSPTYFSKIFKEELSCTFNTYLNRVRIDRGKSLLLNGALSISEICYMVGFQDESYFIKVFRKYIGVTPGQFRRRQGRLDPKKERNSLN